MLTQQAKSDESSVVFNLRQLMQLEHDRLRSEADAVRQQKAAAERARAEHEAAERVLAAEREAAERLREVERARQAEQAELERQSALLRVRLEAEALERSARELREQQHARELQAGKRTRAVILAGGLCAALIGAAIAQRALQAPAVQPAADGGERTLLALQARELEQLRERIASLSARVEPASTPTPAANVTLTPQAKPSRRPAVRKQPLHSGHELDDIEEGGDDPIR